MLAQPIRQQVPMVHPRSYLDTPVAHTVRDPSAGGTTASVVDARWRFPVGRVRYA